MCRHARTITLHLDKQAVLYAVKQGEHNASGTVSRPAPPDDLLDVLKRTAEWRHLSLLRQVDASGMLGLPNG